MLYPAAVRINPINKMFFERLFMCKKHPYSRYRSLLEYNI